MLAAMTSYQSGEAPSEDDGIAAVMVLDTAVLKKVEGAIQHVPRELYRKRKYSKLDIAHARNMVTPSDNPVVLAYFLGCVHRRNPYIRLELGFQNGRFSCDGSRFLCIISMHCIVNVENHQK